MRGRAPAIRAPTHYVHGLPHASLGSSPRISTDPAAHPFGRGIARKIIDNRDFSIAAHGRRCSGRTMWIIQVALRRPYTFIVLALLLPILGALVLLGTPLRPGMPTDIFPEIRIPIIAVTFTYSGMPPDEMSGRITGQIERYVTTLVNDVQHVESQSYPGMTVIKLFFQPGVDVNLAMAQVVAFAQLSLKQMPPGTQPPLIIKYNASSVPIIQLALSSDRLTESQVFDFGNQVIRSQIATVAGASIPYPYGGATRQIQVDLNPAALRAQGLAPVDVLNALATQNLIVPAGTEKIGGT